MKVSVPKITNIKMKDGIFADNVHALPTSQPIPANNVLIGAILAEMSCVVLIGIDKNGEEHIATTMPDHREAAYWFGRGQLEMLRWGDL